MDDYKDNNILIHKINEPVNFISKKFIIPIFLILSAGVFSGYLLFKFTQVNPELVPSVTDSTSDKIIAGSENTEIFSDKAEGTVEKGGINGEGTHKLKRPGGESQTVYLISSVLDLDQFINKKVRVWGQTQAAQKAGWLMDVGRVETID